MLHAWPPPPPVVPELGPTKTRISPRMPRPTRNAFHKLFHVQRVSTDDGRYRLAQLTVIRKSLIEFVYLRGRWRAVLNQGCLTHLTWEIFLQNLSIMARFGCEYAPGMSKLSELSSLEIECQVQKESKLYLFNLKVQLMNYGAFWLLFSLSS